MNLCDLMRSSALKCFLFSHCLIVKSDRKDIGEAVRRGGKGTLYREGREGYAKVAKGTPGAQRHNACQRRCRLMFDGRCALEECTVATFAYPSRPLR